MTDGGGREVRPGDRADSRSRRHRPGADGPLRVGVVGAGFIGETHVAAWAAEGIRVNCLAPGPIDTPMVGRFTAAVTSSIPQIDRVDSQNVTPARSAARAAWTSARWANIPPKPTGARMIGIASSSPMTVVESFLVETSRRTRWRSCSRLRSLRFAASVTSWNAPPSM